MQWYKITIQVSAPEKADIVKAWMAHIDIVECVELESSLEFYFQEDRLHDVNNILNENLSQYDSKIERIEDKNWNEEWEASFKPLVVGDIYVRAEFHEANDQMEELIISPKMAFGTGHHETTFMMLEYMQEMEFEDKSVLDYGCGTGILSVYAAAKGAEYIDAIDIQAEAVENTIEHFEINNLADANYKVVMGDLEVLENSGYDIILANINRNVIQKNGHNLYRLLQEDGKLLVSGILKEDHELILDLYASIGFQSTKVRFKGEWTLMVFKK